ncbi:4381_t:CDS:2 [Entrophospora sp. SA101]|nr:4381_t:CDS:2 [Entrophospora sp. SA101]
MILLPKNPRMILLSHRKTESNLLWRTKMVIGELVPIPPIPGINDTLIMILPFHSPLPDTESDFFETVEIEKW